VNDDLVIHRSWEPDVLGEPYLSEVLPLRADEEGVVEATLVHRPVDGHTRRAVLYVHGFADYFFQRDFAEWWTERGYDFYALDLRKYGRSLREHQTPNYVEDVHDYFEELDQAWQRVAQRDRHDEVVLAAHSTGGLVVSLWADARRGTLAGLRGLVLNSPWLDMQGPLWLRTIGTAAVRGVGRYQPRRLLPRRVDPFYGHSLHRDHAGEWEYDLAWKPIDSWPLYFGWLRAIRRAHAQVHRGLDVGVPVLVLCSGGTHWPKQMSEEVHSFDIVLDVAQIRRWAPELGRHVTIVSIEGALHDVVLSRPDVRARAYDEIERWVATYASDPQPAENSGG
jgi:alpha-beta hydrolase superfamily lysophospholipase